jgi:hypothetical protein
MLQFEIWFMFFNAVMMLLLFPNYIEFNNLNWLMAVLVLNSFLTQIASFHLCNKVYAASVYGGREDSLGLTILLTVRMFVLFGVLVWSLYSPGGLTCLDKKGSFHYPTQIVVLMIIDFWNAVFDLVICACFPKKIKKMKVVEPIINGS